MSTQETQKILMIVSHKPDDLGGMNWHGLRDIMAKNLPEAKVEVTAFDVLTYVTGVNNSAIYDDEQGFDLADFDLVVFRTVADMREFAIASAHYLKHKGVKFIDRYILSEGKGKISSSFMVDDKVPVPLAIFTPNKTALFSAIDKFKIDFPLVFKADLGAAGDDNYLVQSRDELENMVDSSTINMLVQEFIPNQGDYRILVLNGKAKFAMLRRGQNGAYLNNISKGGKAELVDLASLPKQMIKDAEYAAQIARLDVAGVDVIVDSQTGKYYILEINQSPEIETGDFVDEKLRIYSNSLKDVLNRPDVN